jgi:hypothetical protein
MITAGPVDLKDPGLDDPRTGIPLPDELSAEKSRRSVANPDYQRVIGRRVGNSSLPGR